MSETINLTAQDLATLAFEAGRKHERERAMSEATDAREARMPRDILARALYEEWCSGRGQDPIEWTTPHTAWHKQADALLDALTRPEPGRRLGGRTTTAESWSNAMTEERKAGEPVGYEEPPHGAFPGEVPLGAVGGSWRNESARADARRGVDPLASPTAPEPVTWSEYERAINEYRYAVETAALGESDDDSDDDLDRHAGAARATLDALVRKAMGLAAKPETGEE